MKKKIALILSLFALSLIPLKAQIGVAVYYQKASICKQNNGKLSLNDAQNKPIITDIDSIFPTSNVFYHVIKNGKHGIYYKSGKQCIPIEYDDIERLYTDYWLTTKDGEVGLCWSDGNHIFPTTYKDISIIRREGPASTISSSSRKINMPSSIVMVKQSSRPNTTRFATVMITGY